MFFSDKSENIDDDDNNNEKISTRSHNEKISAGSHNQKINTRSYKKKALDYLMRRIRSHNVVSVNYKRIMQRVG